MMVAMVSSVAASLAAPPSLRFATSYGNSMVLQRAPQAGEFERVTRLVTMTCFGIAPLVPAAHDSATHDGAAASASSPCPAVVWGWCAQPPCTSVTVTLDGTAATMATPTVPGTWIVKLPATSGGPTPHTVVVTEGATSVNISDVLFGDVWCAPPHAADPPSTPSEVGIDSRGGLHNFDNTCHCHLSVSVSLVNIQPSSHPHSCGG